MKTVQEKIAVMQAFADGKPIECRAASLRDGNWTLTERPAWDWRDVDYRIKEDQELKAWRLHPTSSGQGNFLDPTFRAWIRNVINAVKAGEIT